MHFKETPNWLEVMAPEARAIAYVYYRVVHKLADGEETEFDEFANARRISATSSSRRAAIIPNGERTRKRPRDLSFAVKK